MSSILDLYFGRKPISKTSSRSKSVRSPPNYSEHYFKQLSDNRNKHFEPKSNKVKSTTINYELEKLKRKRNWDLAISPAKNIPMNALMMYFSPNSLQLIPIMMTLMLFINSFKEMLTVNEKFANVEVDDEYDRNTLKLIFVVCCCGNLLIGLWKLNGMGLIPNRTSDWLAWEPILQSSETTVI